ncbi:MAG: AI-2E family transporter [Eubacteriales bacterium]|nr:AI-2E family transporter [Eubacteriales bacterium]
MKFQWENRYFRWGVTAFLVIAASMLFYYGIFQMKTLIGGLRVVVKILAPVLYGAILAYLLSPIVNFLEQKVIYPLLAKKNISLKKKTMRFIRYTCVFLALAFFLILIYTLIMMILPQLLKSVMNIINSFPQYVDVIQEKLIYLAEHTDRLEPSIANTLEDYASEAQTYLTTHVLPQMQTLLRNISEGVFDVLAFLKDFIIGAIISIYVMADKEIFVAKSKMIVCALLPTNKANAVIRAMRLTNHTFGGFISGKILDSVIIGILCYIGTSMLGTPYAILVSVIVGVTNVIPFFGPYLGAIPCTLLILLIEPIQALYFVIFILVLQQFDGNILGPKILGGSTGLSSFMVIVAILVGGGLFGVGGMVVGVPIFAVLYALVWGFISRSLHRKKLPVNLSDYYEMERVDNQTLEPVKLTRNASASKHSRHSDDAASKQHNILEVEQILSEMQTPDYVIQEPPTISLEDEDTEADDQKNMILEFLKAFLQFAWKYGKIAWKYLRIYAGIAWTWAEEHFQRMCSNGKTMWEKFSHTARKKMDQWKNRSHRE